jgi:hypothetical protein
MKAKITMVKNCENRMGNSGDFRSLVAIVSHIACSVHLYDHNFQLFNFFHQFLWLDVFYDLFAFFTRLPNLPFCIQRNMYIKSMIHTYSIT